MTAAGDLHVGFDLHTHSTRSDGTTAPAALALLAAQAGLTGFALTDHDTLDGWQEAASAAADAGVEFVPGVELSTELGERSVHILGYWVDPDDTALRLECDRLRHERLRRATEMVRLLGELGLPVTLDRVIAEAGEAPIGRPHVAAALVAQGLVPDLNTAFDLYLADGRPAYVPKHALSPEGGVELIRAAGGAAVLAHPGLGSRQAEVDLELLDRLIRVGLAGVEADHCGHDDDAKLFWREAAHDRGLVVTGSSDFHGLDRDSSMGVATTTVEAVQRLRHAAQRGARLMKESAHW